MDNRDQAVRGNDMPDTNGSVLRTLFLVAIGMSLYAYIRLSTNKVVLPAAILFLSVLEVVRLVRTYKESTKLEIVCEATYFLVLLSVFLGAYHNSFADHRTFMFSTIFYRPNYTIYGNRHLALVLSLLILGAVLPITCGITTDSSAVDLLTVSYAMLVSSLWVFCSKVGANIFDF